MKKYLDALCMAQSMFCTLPAPRRWNEDARKHMLLFLPLIGLEAGLVWYIAAILLRRFTVPAPLTAVILTALPLLFTGFIHMDGFMDVCDAVGSWRETEKRRAILKDSHVGSCAVIGCAAVMLALFASFLSFDADTKLSLLIIIPVVSRCCSSFALLTLKPMETSGYFGRPQPSAWVKWLPAAVVAAAVIASPLLFGRQGFCIAAESICYVLSARKPYKLLDGMNGDISGFCLTLSELLGVAVLAIL
ncbi:MAG: adenosylcobinamide-GDP ribazoletransferase [Eubacteriales bacterium]|nr:adenosylcobinamide-GDP ribazoletransferase [Eubacteriales bacterium]